MDCFVTQNLDMFHHLCSIWVLFLGKCLVPGTCYQVTRYLAQVNSMPGTWYQVSKWASPGVRCVYFLQLFLCDSESGHFFTGKACNGSWGCCNKMHVMLTSKALAKASPRQSFDDQQQTSGFLFPGESAWRPPFWSAELWTVLWLRIWTCFPETLATVPGDAAIKCMYFRQLNILYDVIPSNLWKCSLYCTVPRVSCDKMGCDGAQNTQICVQHKQWNVKLL